MAISGWVLQMGSALAEGCKEVVALVRAGEPICLLSPDSAVQDLLGYDYVALMALSLEDVVGVDDLGRVRGELQGGLGTPGSRITIQCVLKHRTGRMVPVEATVHNRTGDGLVDAVVVHVRHAQVTTGAEALPDSGRDVLDRAALLARVQTALDGDERFVVMAVDLDNYKALLGSHGQRVADELMVQVGRRLRQVLVPQSTVAVVGSGEFVVVLHGIEEDEHADAEAEQVSEALRERFQVGADVLTVVAAIGIATSRRRYANAEDVMMDAVAAVTHARGRKGRRRAAFQTKMRDEEIRRITLSNALEDALQTGGLLLHYQPIIALAEGTLAGFEALVRWRHAQWGMLSPGEFISVAEETGLILPLGKWVMQEACRQMFEWHERYPSAQPLEISVNLSPEQFQEERLLELVEGVLKQSGLRPEHLKLEITESAVYDNLDAAHRAIAVLKLYGVRLALDDFGTGYSSLSYLHELPYDTLKIDRSFVSRLGPTDAHDAVKSSNAIVHAMVVLARNLDMAVVAEGVETPEQANWLKRVGCDYAQGYFYARPVPAAEAEQLIQSGLQWG
ncbi:MAG: GGDEF domain-containing protein [Deltaproteobacteria bacterium]|jgi:diguanylate cyclase (GGDEF)-like protein|nr:GGDEF domain-containing protein [Deltaproteobacteria bacterium]MBW2535023.1 GGDEF domain-containing protein [Deltaproteobacteria bacterium]